MALWNTTYLQQYHNVLFNTLSNKLYSPLISCIAQYIDYEIYSSEIPARTWKFRKITTSTEIAFGDLIFTKRNIDEPEIYFFRTQNGFIEGYCDSWSYLYIPPLISKHFQNCTLKFKEICDGNYYSIRNDDEWLLRKIGCILPSNWRCYLFESNFYISFSLQQSKFYKIPQRYLTKARLFALYNSVISEKRIGYIVEVECVRKKTSRLSKRR